MAEAIIAHWEVTRAKNAGTCGCGCGGETSPGKKYVHGHNAIRPLNERLMEKVVWNGDEDECWTWQAALNNRGYGVIGERHMPRLAHRVSYEHFVGPIPDGLVLDHLCRVRHCVNPAHLEAVTQQENTRRGERAQRTHCPHGHEYSPENTAVRKDGSRECRQCVRERVARYRKRKVA
jgi:HNH endonuclease